MSCDGVCVVKLRLFVRYSQREKIAFHLHLPVVWRLYRHQLDANQAHSDVSNEIHVQVMPGMLSLLLRNNVLHDHRTLFTQTKKKKRKTNYFYQHSSINDYEFVFDLIKFLNRKKQIPSTNNQVFSRQYNE